MIQFVAGFALGFLIMLRLAAGAVKRSQSEKAEAYRLGHMDGQLEGGKDPHRSGADLPAKS